MTRLILIGGGRLAGILYATFLDRHEILGYVDDLHQEAYLGRTYGVRRLGDSQILARYVGTDTRVVVAITDPAVRRKYWDLIDRLGLEAQTLIFPTAVVDRFAKLGAGCIVRHQAVVSAQTVIGRNCVVSDLAYVGHDTIVGDHCYLSPGSKLNGSVCIGAETFVGTNAVVLPELKVGSRCTIAASACVATDLADDARVGSARARPLPAQSRPGSVEHANRPTVSVLMSAYNHERFVGEAIQSVLDQSFSDFEFLILDDASKDGTADVIRRFRDPRIRFTAVPENMGISAAKWLLMEQAQGTYVAIQNSDDVYLPGRLDKQVSHLREHPETAAVFTYAQVVDETGSAADSHPLSAMFRRGNRSRADWLRLFFFKGNTLCASSAMLDRKKALQAGYLDRRLRQIQDLDLWIRLCLEHPIHVLEEPLTRVRVLRDHGNASAPTEEVQARLAWEMSRILSAYLRITDQKLLSAVFPEVLELDRSAAPLDRDQMAYLVAVMALRNGRRPWRLFALQTLHDLLGDSGRARRIQERFGFGFRDLVELSGSMHLSTLPQARP